MRAGVSLESLRKAGVAPVTVERLRGLAGMNLLNLPLLFASNARFPTNFMPGWLKDFAQINPVTYGTGTARQFILLPPNWSSVMNDFLFLGAFAVIFATVGIVLSWRYLSK